MTETTDDRDGLRALVGRTITAVHMNEDHLTLTTDDGTYSFEVGGECRSTSHFHDSYGATAAAGPSVLACPNHPDRSGISARFTLTDGGRDGRIDYLCDECRAALTSTPTAPEDS